MNWLHKLRWTEKKFDKHFIYFDENSKRW